MAIHQTPQDSEAAFLQKAELLGEVSGELSIVFAATPIVASAIIEHVFQSIIRQFYENGETYLPNIGLLRYSEGTYELTPSDAFIGTLRKMEVADQASQIATMALIKRKIESCRKEVSPHLGQDGGHQEKSDPRTSETPPEHC